jgi:DNA mismatch repair protein MutH
MSEEQRYDSTSVDSIVEYAKGLIGKSLRQALKAIDVETNGAHKGDLGTLVQTLYFGLDRDNKAEPDFGDARLELKTTGLVERNGRLAAKERLVLSMINFEKIVDEEWEDSALYAKCRLILLLAYLYEKDKEPVDRKFVLGPFLLDLLADDFSTLRADWEAIRQKVLDGKAHELSEGDTFLLGACRKGAGGTKEALRKQPRSDALAKSRAFALKQPFLTYIVQNTGAQETLDLRTVPKAAFANFRGFAVSKIAAEFGFFKGSANQKGYHRQLADLMLVRGGSSKKQLQELGIELKTIRLQKNQKPKEHMSFPGFKFLELIEQEWEDSVFFEKLESKFLFVVYQVDAQGVEIFSNAAYWNMPFSDREEARTVWEVTRERVRGGLWPLPRAHENPVAHVRPKGRNGNDKLMTPQGIMRLKQCFWLNRSFIADVVQNLD